MDRTAGTLLAALGAEAEAVLAALASSPGEASVRLNDLVRATGLPTGHVGRHLRTLEAARLARSVGVAWQATERGRRQGAAPLAA